MLNHVLEATLAFMILLLAMSVAAIVRIGPATTATTATTESNTDSETAVPPGRTMTPMPGTALWQGPVSNGLRPPPPPVARQSSWLAKVRYEGLHARGRMPRQHPPIPAGPPWGPAAPPPARQPQGSDRWT